MFTSFFRIMVSVTLFSVLVIAGDFEEGEKANQVKDYQKAYEYYLKAAEQGNTVAQYKVAYMLDNKIGVDDDHKLAQRWYMKSAERGNSDAQVAIGKIYYEGKGLFILSDYNKAIEWFKKAADQGNSEAEFMIGEMYRGGDGVSDDINIAMTWYRKAAAKNNTHAQFIIGYIYDDGEDKIPKDYFEAMDWYLKAAKQGHATALHNLGVMFIRGKGVIQHAAIAHALFNLASVTNNNNRDNKFDDDEKAREELNKQISPLQVNEAIDLARNPEKLWALIDDVRNTSYQKKN